MNSHGCSLSRVGLSLAVALLLAGCDEPGATPRLLGRQFSLGTTIGSMAEIYSPESVAVEGFSLVGGLQGTGSPQCPPQLSTYLTRYILTRLPEHRIDVKKLIESNNTAVVHVQAILPGIDSAERNFDVKVTALEGTQTISLEGGWLYGVELRIAGQGNLVTQPVATASGPIYIDRIDGPPANRKTGYVLGGGKMLEEYKLRLVEHKPGYESTSNIRNRINERFGLGTARALLPGHIELTIPSRYIGRGQHFISLVKATYMTEDPTRTADRILFFAKELVISDAKDAAEVALEAIGTDSLGKLSVLLNSSNERVRLHAARCMLNLGSDEGLGPLIAIALDTSSALRLEALEALASSAQRNDAAAIARRLLKDADFQVMLAAYEVLRRLDDFAVVRETVAGSFSLEQVVQTPRKAIYATRSGPPRIVLFGAPLSCRGDLFAQSGDGAVIINAPQGQQYVSLVRRHPSRPSSVSHIKTSFDLADIIRVLCNDRPKSSADVPGGLGVPYAEMIALVKQLSDSRMIGAEFRAGPLPKIDANIKK